MKARLLLRLYPRAWRERYGDELAELLAGQQLTVRSALDLVRGAIDAHLHPGLVQPVLAVAGAGVFRFGPRMPRLRASLVVVILALLGWAFAQPLPFLPIFLPIGAHASPQAYARAQEPTLPIRAALERDGIAAVYLAKDGESAVVVATRSVTLGWMGQGGGRGKGDEPSAVHPFAGSGTTFGANSDWAWLVVSGVLAPGVASVDMIFNDGSRQRLAIQDGAFLWFDAKAHPPLPHQAGDYTWWQHGDVFAKLPSTLIALSADGAEVARLPLRFG